MNIHLYKGYHEPQLIPLLKESWQRNELFIFCNPQIHDFSFVKLLPDGKIHFHGSWSTEEQSAIISLERIGPNYPETPVLGLFTSGTSTQGQKLILYSKTNVEFSLQGVLSFFDTHKIKKVFCYPHPFHTFGLLLGYINSIIHGWDFVSLNGKYSSEFHQKWLNEVDDSTLTLGTPTHFLDLIHFVETKNIKPNPSYSCIVGGAPVSPSLWQQIQSQLRISHPSVGYGCTEASPALTHLRPGLMPATEGHIGVPIPGVQIQIQSDGFVFKGNNVCLAIIVDSLISFPQSIHIRDLIEKCPDESFCFRGRSDFVINRGGEKFFLEEIESHLLKELYLRSVAIPLPHARLGQDLALIIETQNQGTSIEKISQSLFDRFKTRFDEKQFLFVNRLPLNESGKINRSEAHLLFHTKKGL